MAGKSNNSSGFFAFLFFILIIIMGVVTAVLVFPAYNKYRNMESEIERLTKELNEKKAECIRLSLEVDGLSNNPKEVEKVAREKFGLCKPGETVYKYKNK